MVVTVPKSEPLTEEQFDRVKELKEEGSLISTEIAVEMGVALGEVNKAIFATTHEDYLSERKN